MTKIRPRLAFETQRTMNVMVQKYRVSIKSFPDYKHLLQENYLEYKYIFLPLLKLVSKIFQQDGAPPQCGSHVRRFLDATFPNRWSGRDGPTPWPPRSPDITPPPP